MTVNDPLKFNNWSVINMQKQLWNSNYEFYNEASKYVVQG